MRSSGMPRRRKRINPVGRRGRQDRDEMADARIELEQRSGGWCEVVDGRRCERRAEHPHHIDQRSLNYSEDRNALSNLLAVCWEHHRRIHDEPEWSRPLGYLI